MEIKKIDGRNTTSLHYNKDIAYITYNELDKKDWLFNAFSTRLGGVSEGIYSSMNLNFNVGDEKENVISNFTRFADTIGEDINNMVFSQQTHTTNVMKADSSMKGMGILRDRSYHDIDGLVTDEPGICLVTSYADCVPLYFADEKHHAIGLSHSGWRGTVGNIAAHTFELMNSLYGTQPQDLTVCIGPSICQSCYEVSADVAEKFMEAYEDTGYDTVLTEKPDGKYLLNLHEACRLNFKRIGIADEKIIMPDICTCCNPKLLFSHRASRGRRGGMCAFLAIK